MNFGDLQKFAPLLSLLGKPSGSISDAELRTVATTLAGDGDPSSLTSFMTTLRDANPDTKVADLLGSDGAKTLFDKIRDVSTRGESGIFCTCPSCGTSFETDL